MKRRIAVIVAAASITLGLVSPATAQDQPRFSAVPIESCLVGASDQAAMEQCIGLSARACMETHDAGFTTMGMSFCSGEELAFWDARLNVAYDQLMERSRDADADMKDLDIEVPSQAEALRDMQRAWLPFRDAACAFERAQWGNGTGGGPAAVACHASLTAKQALALEGRLIDG